LISKKTQVIASEAYDYRVNVGGFQGTMAIMADFEEITVVLPDGYRAYGRFWPTDDARGNAAADAVGAVLYHHGIQSHCGWYEASAKALASAGYAVLQVDRRGCGRNEPDRGHAESADQLIADALAGREQLRRRSGVADHHVVGVSWGGKLAVAAYVHDSEGVKSLSLVTPGLFPKVGVSKEVQSKIGFAMLYEPQQRFDIPLSDAERFSNDPKWQSFFKKDALTLLQCSAGFYLASRRMDKIIARLHTANPLPVHLLLAGDERIIENDRTVAFVDALPFPDTRITIYDNARHSIEFDAPESYFADLVRFIDNANG
jgi:alpha-beta hydrolase superfamily lysophospholipase